MFGLWITNVFGSNYSTRKLIDTPTRYHCSLIMIKISLPMKMFKTYTWDGIVSAAIFEIADFLQSKCTFANGSIWDSPNYIKHVGIILNITRMKLLSV